MFSLVCDLNCMSSGSEKAGQCELGCQCNVIQALSILVILFL